ncbi:MAG: hypothetical protein HOP22_10905 [Nitrospiraceae bacterium]|nr:hypothetical protein [Nitrospiraceae bacterium]
MIGLSRWTFVVALCGALTIEGLASAVHVAVAQDSAAESRPKFDVAIGTWISTGDTRWAHNASSVPGFGNPTSKLTYKDVGTNVIELTAKAWLTPRWFGRLNGGFANIGGGRLTDDDYGSGQRLISRTTSDLPDNSMWYINADLGGRVTEFANHRGYLDLFGGYQYWHTEYGAVGLGNVVCDSTVISTCNDPLPPPGQTVITNRVNWHSIRLGGKSEYRLTRQLSILGSVALLPISIVDNKDIHHLRSNLQQDPSISMLGIGIGADADIGVRFMFTKNVGLNLGYRVWWNRTYDGHVTFHGLTGSSEFPLTQFDSLRHGLTAGLNFTF